MTLKEKLRQNLTGHLSDEKSEVDVNIAEKIADEFAIEFGEWLISRSAGEEGLKLKDGVLEIFKKEKGL